MSLKEQLTKAQTSSQQKILNQKNNKEKSRKFFFELKKEVLSEIKCDKENLNFMNCAATKATDVSTRTLNFCLVT